jgi:hypothetical protein
MFAGDWYMARWRLERFTVAGRPSGGCRRVDSRPWVKPRRKGTRCLECQHIK